MQKSNFKAIYVYGDGSILRFGKGAMQKIARGAETFSVGTPLAAEYNYDTGRWSKLPKALWQDEPYTKPYSWKKGYAVFHYDQEDEIVDLAEELFG